MPLTPKGTWTLTWITPETRPGAEPAKFTVAGTPPMVAVTDTGNCRSDVKGATEPVALAGLVWPPPVAYTEMIEPWDAGVVEITPPGTVTPPKGPLIVPFWLTMAPW